MRLQSLSLIYNVAVFSHVSAPVLDDKERPKVGQGSFSFVEEPVQQPIVNRPPQGSPNRRPTAPPVR